MRRLVIAALTIALLAPSAFAFTPSTHAGPDGRANNKRLTSSTAALADIDHRLDAAETALTVYRRLPPCGGRVAQCSDAAIVTNADAADSAAYEAFMTAQKNEADATKITAAKAAMAAFEALVAKLPKVSP